MFKSALYHHRSLNGSAVHTLRDDLFQTLITSDTQIGLSIPVLKEYIDRNLSVASNMALYYLWVTRDNGFGELEYRQKRMDVERKHILLFYPSWQYEKIYPCIVRQIKQRTFFHKVR